MEEDIREDNGREARRQYRFWCRMLQMIVIKRADKHRKRRGRQEGWRRGLCIVVKENGEDSADDGRSFSQILWWEREKKDMEQKTGKEGKRRERKGE